MLLLKNKLKKTAHLSTVVVVPDVAEPADNVGTVLDQMVVLIRIKFSVANIAKHSA